MKDTSQQLATILDTARHVLAVLLLLCAWCCVDVCLAQSPGGGESTLLFTEVCVANVDQTIDHSNNYGGWVELYNPTSQSVSIDGWYISDDAAERCKHRLEGNGAIPPGGYKCLFFGHHASEGVYGPGANKQVGFKLNKNGGILLLSPDSLTSPMTLVYPPSVPRCSYALTDLMGDTWSYCGRPTPGAANAGGYAMESLDLPEVDCDSRLSADSFTVHVTFPAGTTLRYTLDGSTPTLEHGQTSEDGIFPILKTTVLRLRLFAEGYLPSGVVTRSYIQQDKAYYLPLVLITTDQRHLYDNQIGCYVDGKNGVIDRGSKVASNLNMDWERPVNFEYITADGQMVINQESSFEVVGGYSRHFAPASFKLQAKKLYDGHGSFGHPVFASKPYLEYEQLIVRNGGNNNRTDGGPRIKDPITQQILTSSGYYVDAQEYQPAHVFINGKYLAMMNVREPNNRYHGVANYGYDNDEMDSFEYSEGSYHQKKGSREAFERLVSLSAQADTDEGYAALCQLIDIEEFVRYMAAICYTSSYDWILNGNNVKGYRSWKDGKFHFVFFDQDSTWSRTDNVETIDGVTVNELLVIYNNLKRNAAFRRQFLASYSILHGSIYTPERCKQVADSICRLVKDALSFEKRNTTKTYDRLKLEMWGEPSRSARIQSLIRAYQLTDSLQVTLQTNHPLARISLEGQELPFSHFCGVLFGSERVSTACAEGYEFLGWQDEDGLWISRDKAFSISREGTYTAVYNLTPDEALSPLCINEVGAANGVYVNDYGKHADWIELYNRGTSPVDVSEYAFGLGTATSQQDLGLGTATSQVDFGEDAETVLQPGEHMVVWCDGKPALTQPHLPFKLKNGCGDVLSLESADGRWTDTLSCVPHASGESLGRYPDGGSLHSVFYHSSIGKANMATLYDTVLSGDVIDAVAPLASADEVVSVTYYTLDGRRALPRDGVYLEVTRYRDGRRSARKVMR